MRPGKASRSRKAVLIGFAILAGALAVAAQTMTAQAAPTQAAPAQAGVRAGCEHAQPKGEARCLVRWRPAAEAKAAGGAPVPSQVQRQSTVPLPTVGFGPADAAAAYAIDSSRQVDQTVGIVIAFDNPNLEADLAVYRAAFGLPPCTSANGCFRKVNQRGEADPPAANVGWGIEAALDVQMASAACSTCKLLIVEADTNRLGDMGKATRTAVRIGADVVNHSYGADEFNGILEIGQQYYTHPAVPMVAASGDDGFATASIPASLPATIAVGGTSLILSGSGSSQTWDERVWQGSGSGCSAWAPKPAWQKDRNCRMRTIADIAAVADPETGMAFYDTFGLGEDAGWLVGGGTSQASPLIAGWIALAGNADSYNDARGLYTSRTGLFDVIKGTNVVRRDCGGDNLCTAKPGYDAPTGVGTPRGLGRL